MRPSDRGQEENPAAAPRSHRTDSRGRMPSAAGWSLRLLLVLTSLCIAVLVSELGLRILAPLPDEAFGRVRRNQERR
jgi:hypothetical protein